MADSKEKNSSSESKGLGSIPWVCDFTEQRALSFHEELLEAFEENPHKPIIIHINSYGGEVDALFSMLDSMDIIRAMAPPEFSFFTVASGKACSAGAVLLSYGDVRFATPNCRVMIHQVVSGTWGSQPANEVEFSETSRMNRKLLNILRKRCKVNMTAKDFKQKLSHNLYFTPEQAKEFGIIDVIGYPKLIEKSFFEAVVLNGEVPPKEPKRANRRTN